jgi:hypothetical protein
MRQQAISFLLEYRITLATQLLQLWPVLYRDIRIDQPVLCHEAASAEAQPNSRRATMSIVDRICGGRRLTGGHTEYLSHVLAIGKRDRWAGEHDESFRAAGKRHKSVEIAKQPIGTTHNLPHVRTHDQWKLF